MLSPLINTTEQAMIPIKSIINEGGTQMRAGLDQTTVAEYAEALAAGVTLPPIILFHDGESYWLADGFHRFAAWKRAFGVPGNPSQYLRPEIPAEVRAGNRRDAILFAAGANASHGLRRTNADKRRAVEVLLNDEEWAQWSNREIARRCTVDETLVRKMREDMMPPTAVKPQSEAPDSGLSAVKPQIDTQRTVQRGGQTYQQNTTNIGTNRPASRPIMAIWELERYVETVYKEAYPEDDVMASVRDMRQGAQKRMGRFWQLCVEHINSNDYRHGDLAQAINNVADQKAQRSALRATTAELPKSSPTPDTGTHLGAGRTPPPALTLDELVEDLGGYLANVPAAELAAASKGAQNKALETALFCLQDMTYRTADLYRALARLALQRGAPAAQSEPPHIHQGRPVFTERDMVAWVQKWVSEASNAPGELLAMRTNDQILDGPLRDYLRLDGNPMYSSALLLSAVRQVQAELQPAERLDDLPVVATTGPVVFIPAPDSPPLPEWVNAPSPDNNTLPAQPEPEQAASDPWAVALDHVGSRQSTVERLARAMQPWLREYKDDLGRDAAHIAEFGNPSHSNAVFWQDINRELGRRGLTVREDTLKEAIKQAFAWFLADVKRTQPPAPEPAQSSVSKMSYQDILAELAVYERDWWHLIRRKNQFGQELLRMISAKRRMATAEQDGEVNLLRRMRAAEWSEEEYRLWEKQQAQPPAPEPNRHPRYDDLQELKEIFRLTIKSLREWAVITGQHTDILAAERELRKLGDATVKLLEEYK